MGDPVMQWQIVSKQPDAHAGFYSAVFGWQTRSDNPMGYLSASTESERGISGGFWPAPPQANAFVQLFLEVSDMAKAIDKVSQHGGSVLIPPQTYPKAIR